MTLVAFNGELGSGKDTAGERLAAMVGVSTHRISFARLLKESAAALLDIDIHDWEAYKNDAEVKIYLTVGYEPLPTSAWHGEDIPEQPRVVREFTAREFLQRYGTESHRDVFGTDFWVDQALSYVPTNGLTYITDCRFSNEASAVLRLGGVVVNVVGPDEGTSTHASEAALPPELITFYIDNTNREDDLASLDQQLRSIASMVGIPTR